MLGRFYASGLRSRLATSKTLRSLGRIDEALRIQEALKKELVESKAEDGYVDEELGECLLALKRPEEARPHVRQAHELLSKDAWLAENEPSRIERLQRLGRP